MVAAPVETQPRPTGVRKRTAQEAGHAAAPAAAKRPAAGAVSKSAPPANAARPSMGPGGLSAKMPSPPPPAPGAPAGGMPRPAAKKAKAPGSMSKRPPGAPGAFVKSAGPPPSSPATAGASPTVAAPLAGMQSAVGEMLASMKAAQGQTKLTHITILADALVRGLQIDHLNVLLKVMKKKLAVRAQREGVRPPDAATSTPSAPQGEGASAPEQAPEQAPAQAPAQTPATPQVNGGTSAAAKPAIAKSGPAVAKSGPAIVKSGPAIAKSGPAVSTPNAPVMKAKAPTPKAPTPKTTSPGPGVRQDSAGATSMDAGSPPPSPPPQSPQADVSEDPLFVLVGEIADDPVVQDGALRDDRLQEVLRRLWFGAAKRPKDWVAAWQAMTIPVEKQAEAISALLNMAFADVSEDAGKAPSVVTDLVKNHKVKMKSVEESLLAFGSNIDGLIAMNPEALQFFALCMLNLFPKPSNAGWGWSRVGWSWQSWWQCAERCVGSLEPERALDVLVMVMRLIQEREGLALAEQQAWTSDKLEKAVTDMASIGACGRDQVIDRLAQEGIEVPAPLD